MTHVVGIPRLDLAALKRLARLAFVACACVLLLPQGTRAGGGIWMYEDENGSVSFTDSPRHAGYRQKRVFGKRRPAYEHRVAKIDGPTKAWDHVIRSIGRRYSIEPGLVKAVIHVESLFNPSAVSHRGAQGLMQLMPATAKHLGVDDPFDPWQNISGGTRYLGYLMRRFDGDLTLSLAAYNAGETRVRRYGGVPPYKETQRYVKRVLKLYKRYDADFR